MRNLDLVRSWLGKENDMSTLPLTAYELQRYGAKTELADWVLGDEDLSAGSIALYARFCYEAQQERLGGKRFTVTREWADWASGGDGSSALQELLAAGALTKFATYLAGSKIRFQEEGYPPTIQKVLDGSLSRYEVPELACA